MPKVPEDNPLTFEKVELGRHLFYDKRLSGNGTQSCASCHEQARAFTDGKPVGIGSTGQAHVRSAMSLANVAYAESLTWANTVLHSLEQQALVPLIGEDPVELGLTGKLDTVLQGLREDAMYSELFADAFPDATEPFSLEHLVAAIGIDRLDALRLAGAGGAIPLATTNLLMSVRDGVFNTIQPSGLASIARKYNLSWQECAKYVGVSSYELYEQGYLDAIIDFAPGEKGDTLINFKKE